MLNIYSKSQYAKHQVGWCEVFEAADPEQKKNMYRLLTTPDKI